MSCGFKTPNPNNVISDEEAIKKTGIVDSKQAVYLAQLQQGNNSIIAPYVQAVMDKEEEKCKDSYPMTDWRRTQIYSQILSSLSLSNNSYVIIEGISPEDYINQLFQKGMVKEINEALQKGRTVEGDIPTTDQCFCDRFHYKYDVGYTPGSTANKVKNGNTGPTSYGTIFKYDILAGIKKNSES